MRTNEARRLMANLGKEIHLGTDRHSGADLFMPLEEMKKTSVHIVGAAGYGKSFYLRNLIRQFVKFKVPFALIDPHRELYEFALTVLRRSAVPSDRVLIVDPADDRYSVAFNPLYCGLAEPDEAASLVLEACLKAWGHQSFDNTPRLEGLLRGLFRLLIESRLTLLEAPEVLNVDNAGLRALLRERVGDDLVRQDWAEFEKLPRVEKLAVAESSRNRLRRFIQSERIQYMLGQTENTLDLQSVMDRGQFLLANIGALRAPETQRLLGALLVNGIFHAAKQRDPGHRKDYFLIIDECGQFATRDLTNSLDELRKFGIQVILAHQRLQQLDREDEDITSAVMTNAKLKVVFGGLERPEAERMARELFTGRVRGNKVKHIARQTKFRPVLDTFEVETESSSESESDSTNSGSSRSFGKSEGQHDMSDDPDATYRTESRVEDVSESRGHSSGRSYGTSRSIVPVTVHKGFEEETGRQYWGVDEQWEALIARVHQLGKREALIRIFNGPVRHVTTPNVRDEHDERARDRFKEKSLSRCANAKTAEAVRAEIDARREELQRALAPARAVSDIGTKTFRE